MSIWSHSQSWISWRGRLKLLWPQNKTWQYWIYPLFVGWFGPGPSFPIQGWGERIEERWDYILQTSVLSDVTSHLSLCFFTLRTWIGYYTRTVISLSLCYSSFFSNHFPPLFSLSFYSLYSCIYLLSINFNHQDRYVRISKSLREV